MGIRINLTSVFVDDQAKALEFYTAMLGFVTKTDVPVGEFRWLTVVGPAEPDGTELLLEPDQHPAAKAYTAALAAMAFPPHRSPSSTSRRRMPTCQSAGWCSRRSRPRWDRWSPPSSTTHAATSSS